MAVLPRATSRQQYEQWFKEADKNQDGVLTAKELKKMFKSKGYKTSNKVFKQQFAMLDADSDKKVTIDEYLNAMIGIADDKLEEMMEGSSDSDSDDDVTTGRPTSSAEFEKWFKEADKNQDGFLTAKELKGMFKKHFANFDTDGDKKITLEEYLRVMSIEPEVKQTSAVEIGSREHYQTWFREADTNNDGYLTAKELKKILKTKGLKMSSKAVKTYFATLDRDKDKKISLDEYLDAMGYVMADDRPANVESLPKTEPSHQTSKVQSKQTQHESTPQSEQSLQGPAPYSEQSQHMPTPQTEQSQEVPVLQSEQSQPRPTLPSEQPKPKCSTPAEQSQKTAIAQSEQSQETILKESQHDESTETQQEGLMTIASYNIDVNNYNIDVDNYNIDVDNYNIDVDNYNIDVDNYNIDVVIYNIDVNNYNIDDTYKRI
ncbi:hypothetical protein LSH36_189g06079 [Paralvinella palmiformis]|uniref:EF-hand domain-containing protein n=1 Tax=Paralvinella palmiformis TaxID=53620 RepID=A0AAD9N780_9ANNE|nr:hypothetical protein LSH36_189g06079 [Paralvinella palmiformis]